jgi:putative membrane protein
MQFTKISFKALAIALCLGMTTSCAQREETDTTMSSDTNVTVPGSDHGGMIGDSAHNGMGGAQGTAGSGMGASMNDGNILAFMSMSDSLEIAMGNMARTKAKNADVKKFAQMMVTEHTKMKKEGQTVAQRQNLTPQMPAGDMMGADMTSTMTMLQSASGAQFDSLYIASQIMAHERVLQNLNGVNPQDTALAGLVNKAKPHVQHHLEEARRIQGTLTASGNAGR